MLTRDGVRLDADVYFPAGEGPFPVLLMRQPYGRAIASTIVYAHPCWYASHGYIVVIQDVRGRGTSEGTFELFAHEVADGEDTVNWAAQLPKSDGQVGMYGFSYQGMTQLHAAQSGAIALKTIAPAMTGYHLYEDWAWENDAFCYQLGLVWALQLAAETARIDSDNTAYLRLLTAAKSPNYWESCPGDPEALRGIDSFYHDWVNRPKSAPYWQQLTPDLTDVDLPLLQVGGWFDPYLRGDLRLHRQWVTEKRSAAHFYIGPWGHIPWGRKVGEVDFGPAAASPIDQVQLRWFDAVLKQKRTAALWREQSVHLFEMGRNQWRTFDKWPCPPQQSFGLLSDGLANMREDSGQLVQIDAIDDYPPSDHDLLVHDPWNPSPARGGHSSLPSGMFERTDIDSRGDVLTYTTAPLEKELRVAGVPLLKGAIASSHISFDLCAVVSRVCSGCVYNLTQGYISLLAPLDKDSDEVCYFDLKLQPTCFSLMAGEQLRLSLSGACFPAYPINPGTGASVAESRLIDSQIITLSIHWGGQRGTILSLPLAPD